MKRHANRTAAALFLITTGAYAASPAPTAPQLPEPDTKRPDVTYEFCLNMTRQEPEKSFLFSGRWLDLGGGDPARHCQALSLIGLKDYSRGAQKLEELAEQLQNPAPLRTAMLAQAGQAWLLEEKIGRAYEAQSAGLKLAAKGSKEQSNLLVDRAATLAEGKKYREAVDDLNLALSIRPGHADALAFRASAHRHLDAIDAAMTDAEAAVKADPNNVNALLERATLYRLKNRLTEARLDWVALIQLAPDSEAAKAARQAIEQLDVKY
ncbi:MAG: hypothetical protein EXQ84_06410 [Rhodospirillaceae bacterium]|nr:hypothetical protein [Rhodospirillaceae bacterium]